MKVIVDCMFLHSLYSKLSQTTISICSYLSICLHEDNNVLFTENLQRRMKLISVFQWKIYRQQQTRFSKYFIQLNDQKGANNNTKVYSFLVLNVQFSKLLSAEILSTGRLLLTNIKSRFSLDHSFIKNCLIFLTESCSNLIDCDQSFLGQYLWFIAISVVSS